MFLSLSQLLFSFFFTWVQMMVCEEKSSPSVRPVSESLTLKAVHFTSLPSKWQEKSSPAVRVPISSLESLTRLADRTRIGPF